MDSIVGESQPVFRFVSHNAEPAIGRQVRHVRVAHCVNCQVTLGAAAGLLTVHGCERSAVTACARAMVLSSCIDVQLHTMLARSVARASLFGADRCSMSANITDIMIVTG